MSREDVEVVRAIYQRWRRGDSARELFDPEIELSTPHPDSSAIRGREELLAFLRRNAGTWQDYRIELEEIRDVEEHRVLVLFSRKRARQGQRRGNRRTTDRGMDRAQCRGRPAGMLPEMVRESVELGSTRLSRLAAGDVEERLSLVDPEVSWSRCSASSGGEAESAVGNCADGFATFGSPTGVCGPCLTPSRIMALACWCSDGSSVPAGSEKGTSTFPSRGSGPSAPDASSPVQGLSSGARGPGSNRRTVVVRRASEALAAD